MKKCLILSMLLLLFTVGILISGANPEGKDLFPEIGEFTIESDIDTYSPDTLFEYINGGADLFINFEFIKLYSAKYKNRDGAEISADIYIHRDLPNGYGIYSQEKPEDGNFIKIGTEGYYEDGVLNFFKGPIYIKLNSFDLGEDEEIILKKLAGGISKNISFKKGYPRIFSMFPSEGKIPGSDKFTNLNFLGHSFLKKVYSREYLVKGKTIKVFIIKGNSDSGIREILSKYTGFIKSKGEAVKQEGEVFRFVDPYYKSEGKMNILLSGNFLTGMFSDDLKLFIKLTGSITGWDKTEKK